MDFFSLIRIYSFRSLNIAVDLPLFLKQVVKTQNSSNGELSQGVVA
jgi:hypothetical protein